MTYPPLLSARSRTPTMTLDIAELKAWTGRQEIREDVVTPVPVAALAATLDRDDPAPAPGTPLPPLWHWLYFLPLHRQSELGPDGHAKRGGFLPPVPLPRRMWAGGRFDFRRPLRVGDAIRRTSTDRRRQPEGGPHRPARLRPRAPRDRDRRGRGAGRGARHRLPRPARGRRGGAGAAAGPHGRRLAPRHPPRRRAAVPLLGADLQRPPHPLRPALRHRGRGLSRARSSTGRCSRRCSPTSCAGTRRRR